MDGMTLPSQCHVEDYASLWLVPAVSLLEWCVSKITKGRMPFPSSFTSLSSIRRFSSNISPLISCIPLHSVAPDELKVSGGITVV